MAKLFKIETNKIVTAKYTFSAVDYNNNSLSSALKSWSSDLSKLTDGSGMFYKCSNLETFYGDLGVITSGRHMFSGCSKLRSVSSTNSMFVQLLYGREMFNGCSSLNAFNYNLGKLTEGDGMFKGCSSLSFFYGEMSSLTSGASMFENCTNLEKFENNAGETHLAKLSNGYRMFYGCSSLTSFYGNLSSLSTGDEMFTGCKLDSDSVETILKTISSANSGYLTISMDESGCRKAAEMMSLTSGTIPTYTSSGGLDVVYKNWKLLLTSGYGQDFVITSGSGSGSGDGNDMSSFAIVEGSQYIPDASDWNKDVFVPNKLYEVITDVVDETAYSGNSGSGNSGDLGTKYIGCMTVDEVKAVDPNYKTNDIINGAWSERLDNLINANLNDGISMFYECSALRTFTSDLSSLTNGADMFAKCSNLTTFSADLPSLTNGYGMFLECSNLTSFASDSSGSPVNLSSLTNGDTMFYGCTNLTSFSSDLSNLTNGDYMFSGCTNLTSFISDLSSLTDGSSMFYECSELTTFSSDLSSLTDGSWMFYNCKLNTASVQNIADTINTHDGTIYIGIGNTTPNEQEEEAFNKMVSKGWRVYVNGYSSSNIWTPTATTPIDGEQTTTPIPFWAKPIQSDEKHAHYVDENGNYYNILGGNFIYGDSLETYGMFVSEEDAAANMRLTKIERN